MPKDHIYREVVKSGTGMEISKALSTCGITDENGNTVKFSEPPLPKYYVESGGMTYSLEGLERALVTVRIEKLSVQHQQQQAQESQTKNQIKIGKKSGTNRSDSK
jgi:hypothetical protein